MGKSLTLGVTLLLLSLPMLAPATTLVVDPGGGGTHATLGAALDAARNDAGVDRIFVRRGTYGTATTLVSGVTVQGEETTSTFLTSAVTLAEGAVLERFTLSGTVTATGLSSTLIRNNIFSDVSASTDGRAALLIKPEGTVDSGVRVVNNTFFNNGIGLRIDGASAAIVARNLFVKNTTAAVSRSSSTAGVLEENRFHQNGQNVTPGPLAATNTVEDPGFVDGASSSPDLHVALGSSACGLGAFGDLDAEASPDTTPSPPTGLSVQDSGTNAKLSWDGNLACDTTVSAFRIWFRPLGATAFSRLAETTASGTGTQTFLVDRESPDLGTMPAAPAAPAGVRAAPLDGALRVNWNAVSNVDGYVVAWGEAADDLSRSEEAGTGTTHVVENLANGAPYFAAVASFANRWRQFTVTAVPEARPADEATGESRAPEAFTAAVGRSPSRQSSVVTATPDSISGFPSLEDRRGCFLDALGCARNGRGIWAAWAGWLLLGFLFSRCALRRPARRSLAVGALLSVALAAPAPAASAASPRWAVAAGGGVFLPRQADWSDNYEDGHLWEGKLGVGFRLLRQLEIGVDGGFRRARGDVAQTDNGTPIEPPTRQTLSVVPLQAYLMLQLCFAENQWVVPYVAGGYSRYYYRHEVDHGDKVSGHQDGYHARGGLKILLNVLDPYFAARASQNWGVWSTYLSLEGQYAKVDDRGASDTNLGGLSYSAGFVIEF